MATDQKLVAQLLDLSRNVEKLSGEIKKNTSVNKDLVKSDSVETKSPGESKDVAKIAEGLKSLDFKGLKDEFKGLKEGLKGIDKLDFKGLENGLKSLDFKGLEKGIKGLDFKGITETLKGFDSKGITESLKGIADLKNIDLGGVAKNLTSSAGVKDFISGNIGNIGKGILGGFESGGKVKVPGAYLVGEKGPEIANLPKDTIVTPNDKIQSLLSENPSSINAKLKAKNGTKYPSKEEVDAKRSELLKSDPNFYSDPDELNDELEYFINNYKDSKKSETFTMEDVAKLGKPATKTENAESKEIVKPKPEETKNKEVSVPGKNNAELKEKKPGLFSKIFSKDNIKDLAGKAEAGAAGFIGGGLKDKISGGLKGSAEMLINKSGLNIPEVAKSSITSGLSFLNKSSKESIADLGIGGVDIKKNLPSLSNLPISKNKIESPQKPTPAPESKPTNVAEAVNNQIPSVQASTSASESSGDKMENKVQSESSITKKDIDTIIAALGRIGSLLEGPLSVSSLDQPMRPDSRRI